MDSNKKVSVFCYGITCIIFLIITIIGMFFLGSGNEMGYTLLNFYIIMPVTCIVTGIILGIKNGFLKWGYPFVVGILGLIIPALVFSDSWDWFLIIFTLIPATIGLLIGSLVNKLSAKE